MGNLFLRTEGPVNSGAWTYAALGLACAALMLPSGPWTSVALIGFAALIYCLARERTLVGRVLSTKLLLFGGGISYAMYLLQAPVRNWVHPWITQTSRIPWQLAIVPVVLTALSAVVFLYYEDPARRTLRAVLARMRFSRPAQ
jgi:peptidoglycan/LPS O-acetylase OafA/YrhL